MFVLELIGPLLKGRGRLIAEAALVALVVFAAVFAVHRWSAARFKAGYDSRQAEVAALVERKNAEQATLQATLQGKIDDISKRSIAQQARTDELVASLVAYGDGLRDKIRRASAPRLPSRPSADGTCPPDERAPALGQLLESSTRLAEGLGADAERLADTVRGLQSYARSVEQQAAECFRPDPH